MEKSSAEVMPELLRYRDVVLADVDAANCISISNPMKRAGGKHLCAFKRKLPHVRVYCHDDASPKQRHQQHVYRLPVQDGAVVASQAYPINALPSALVPAMRLWPAWIHALRRKKPASEAIEFATACGAIKHTLTVILTWHRTKTLILLLNNRAALNHSLLHV
jgi:2-dehydro-3-deoxygluconokinase